VSTPWLSFCSRPLRGRPGSQTPATVEARQPVNPAVRDLELLQAIIQNLDDDTPRLIYADWLEEHGNLARAEFIRAQCESARLFRSGKDLERAFALRVQHTDLLRQHEKKWVGEFPNKATSWTFERGFIEYVAVEAVNFLKYAESLFTNTPIRRLYIRDVGEHLPQIAESPQLARLSHLYLSHLGQGNVMPLVRSPYLNDIAHLEIWNHAIITHGGLATPSGILLRQRFGNRVRF
jgi:uncharacterized protein (TIGR02996 family)